MKMKRAFAELAVIFAGVTLGLLADDWRLARQELAEANDALALLERDLVVDSAELDAARGVLARHSEAAVWFQVHWKRDSADTDAAGRAFLAYLAIPQFTFPRSAFEGLRTNNRLSLIQPDFLRGAVIEYYDRQAFIRRNHEEQTVPEKKRTVDALSPYFLRPPAVDTLSAWPIVSRPAEMTAE
jgi:hypothetical protein